MKCFYTLELHLRIQISLRNQIQGTVRQTLQPKPVTSMLPVLQLNLMFARPHGPEFTGANAIKDSSAMALTAQVGNIIRLPVSCRSISYKLEICRNSNSILLTCNNSYYHSNFSHSSDSYSCIIFWSKSVSSPVKIRASLKWQFKQ